MSQEPDSEYGDLAQIGTPVGTGVERSKPSRAESAESIADALGRLKIHRHEPALVRLIGEQIEQFDEARAEDAQPGDAEVIIGYSIDLDSTKLTRDTALAKLRLSGDEAYQAWGPLWSQYPDVALNQRRFGEKALRPRNPFQGRVVGWLLGGDHPTEEGLHLTNRTVAEQRTGAAADIAAYQAAGRNRTDLVMPATGDFIMLHATATQSAAYHGVALSEGYEANLVQHEAKPVTDSDGNTEMWVPNTHRLQAAFGLGGAALNHFPHPNTGVQFLVVRTK